VPYVNLIRHKSARAQSVNNLKQLSIAVLNYESANGVLPPGVNDLNYSASAHLLPYIEQNNVFQMINFTKDIGARENAAARKIVVRTFLNPGDPVHSVSDDWGAINYLFSAGTKADLVDNDGVFFRNSKVKIVDITDGTSNTLQCGETLKGDSGMKAMDVHRQYVRYKKDDLGKLTADSGVRDFQDNKNIAADRGASWMDGRFLQGTFTVTRSVNDPKPDVDCSGFGGLSGLRSLSDSVNVSYCDGSVRAINQKVAAEVWRALATRDGGEVIPDF
jgi:prepilin-type processing-associated H-X9-DG protein